MDDHTPECDDEGCYCSDDVFWARLLGDDDPCAPGKDWQAAAFTHSANGGDLWGQPIAERTDVAP